ncbi:hypothetical protein [Paraburkholderia sp. J76]|uniref:hypothetical protein n=1 Tax=Paraburkholderia sp. J76 TaxID=2805439 RepID=UPI002ABD858A|nr:hypothetical protein [Paraburkholderia sp. J76]
MSHQSEKPEQPEDAADPRGTDLSRPFGDAVPAPTEPGLDQPLPPKTPDLPADPPAQEGDESADESDAAPQNDISKPLGDAVPTPVEPGQDQPLPPKKHE